MRTVTTRYVKTNHLPDSKSITKSVSKLITYLFSHLGNARTWS